jgi:hypothetical protein
MAKKMKMLNEVEGRIPLGMGFNGIEVVKPQTELRDAERDYCYIENTKDDAGTDELNRYIDKMEEKARFQENAKKHGPIIAEFFEETRENEKKQIEAALKRNYKKGMLSEKDIETLQKKWEESNMPLSDFLNRFNECAKERPESLSGHNPDYPSAVSEREMIEKTKKAIDFLHGKTVNDESGADNNKETYVAPDCRADDDTNGALIPGDFDGICRDLMALHARKNKDYGNAAHESYKEFGLISYVIRLNDKMKRLKSLTKPGVEQEIKSESIEDTLMDLAAYAIMAIESLRS